MKIGTLNCKLFGHKFVETVWRDGIPHIPKGALFDSDKVYESKQTQFCVRCGINKS